MTGPRHIVQFDESGWTLMHPLTCRPELFDCPTGAEVDGQQRPAEPGRYECWLDEDGVLVIGDRTDQVAAARDLVLIEIAEERDRQDDKWGEQNHPDGTGESGITWPGVFTQPLRTCAEIAKLQVEHDALLGKSTWMGILLEETLEALAEEDTAWLRYELLQVAAVATAWVEAIDRRLGGDPP